MKWYWHVPLVNIFFIHEYAEWALDNNKSNEFVLAITTDTLIGILAIIVLI
jgi:hypothetical protein